MITSGMFKKETDRCHLSAAQCQLGRSVLAQHIADCQLGCKVSARWQIVSSSENFKLSLKAQLQSLGSIATCQLSLTMSWICRFVHEIWNLQGEGSDDHLPFVITAHMVAVYAQHR